METSIGQSSRSALAQARLRSGSELWLDSVWFLSESFGRDGREFVFVSSALASRESWPSACFPDPLSGGWAAGVLASNVMADSFWLVPDAFASEVFV